jgi:hypothetical protein
MIDYAALEDSIVGRLAAITPAVEVEALPDTPAKFQKAFSKPRVTVAYRSSEFAKDIVRGIPEQFSTGPAIQDEFASIEVVIQSRTVRGNGGCHAVKSAVVGLLFNFTPANWSRLTLESYKFVDHDKEAGLFSYAATFITQTRVVPDMDVEDLVNLELVTFNVDGNGNS